MTTRILAVEDSPTQATALRAALESGGYEVTVSGSGEDALLAMETGTFDVVLSGVVMPGSVDGYELCRRVKAEYPALPVVLLTSLSDPLDIIRGLEAGADNFLTKPYTTEHLLERLGVLLANRRSRSRGRVQAGVSVQFMDRQWVVTSEREQILDLLVTTFEDAVRQNQELRQHKEEIARARERLLGMYNVAVTLNHCTSEDEVVQAALDGAMRLPRVRAVWISLREGETGFRAAGARNMPDALAGPTALDGDCRCRRMLLAGELDSVTNILECECIARAGPDAHDVRFHAGVPLHCGEETIGVMNLLSEDQDLFDEDDRTILYGIGSQIGFAIERARRWQRLETLVDEQTRKLKESEEQFRTLVTEVNDGFFVTDAQGVITFANRALVDIHGVDEASDLVGHAFLDFIPADMRDDIVANFRRGMEGGDMIRLVTIPILRPDGREVVAEIRPTVVLRDGLIVGTRGVVHDVTERVHAQRALLLSDNILNRIADVVLVADGSGEIVYASPSVEAVLGYAPPEILGEGWWTLAWADAEAATREREAMARCARGETPTHADPIEKPVRAADGATHWLLWRESKGPEDLVIGVGHDITERKALQEQFLQSQKMEAVGRLAGGIAHDFNNVLTSILITTELLLPTVSADAATVADVNAIRSSAQRAAGLTQQLLAFSRKQVLQPKVVNLNDLVHGMEGMLGSLLGEDIAIEALLAPDLGNVEMDPGKLEQVIMNLAVNARDAMPKGGRLVLETRNAELNGEYVRTHVESRPGPYVILTVTDNGAGIAPDVMEHIFEPFFTTKGVGSGTGLGLATVHGIVNQSGGHIWVYSEPGEGTTFKIYLPRVASEVRPSAPPAPRTTEITGTETILLVEDDDAVRRATERVLKRMGYKVICAGSGAEAIAAIKEHEGVVGLMITDVVMPGMTGPDLARQLVRTFPALRVLFVSGYTDDMVARRGLLKPGRHFLEKPYALDELLARVRDLLDSPVSHPDDLASTETP